MIAIQTRKIFMNPFQSPVFIALPPKIRNIIIAKKTILSYHSYPQLLQWNCFLRLFPNRPNSIAIVAPGYHKFHIFNYNLRRLSYMETTQVNICSKIQSLCPNLTNEVVDLLYQYFIQKYNDSLMDDFCALQNDKSFQKIIDSIIGIKN